MLPGAAPQTSVFVLTGFLGSGKTTLLSRLVRQPELADTAVIINEFGDVGLDHLLVAKGEEDDVVLLDSGCLCCAMNSSLGETLTDLFHRRERGDVPAFRRVIIETSGLADPAPILNTLMSDRFIASRYGIAAIIATVDATSSLAQWERYREVPRQVALADRLVITKVDVSGEDAVRSIKDRARTVNPWAPIIASAHGDVPPEELLPAGEVGAAAVLLAGAIEHGEPHGIPHHSEGIAAHYFPVPDAVSWPQYSDWVSCLQKGFGERLLRVKGLLSFEGEKLPQVVQGVQHVFAPPTALNGTATGTPLGLVVIVDDVKKGELDDAFALLME